MTSYANSYKKCAQELIEDVGKKIVIGVPLGLGKPIGLLNALFSLAMEDASLNLTIITGLTLARPIIKNELEKRFIQPILERVLKDFEDPLYEKYRELQILPKNINVIEFFLMPGKFLHNQYVQQHYISSSYTTVVRDVFHLGVNVLAQLVAPSKKTENLYSLSCNTDLFHGLWKLMKKAELSGKRVAIIAEVNAKLPYMYGEVAEVPAHMFSSVIDTKVYRSLFAAPREALSIQDHLIGLYTSTLIKDDGCLQIGIGQLSNALANALILRHTQNNVYHDILSRLDAIKKFGEPMSRVGSLRTFDDGLYASTEMLSDEYLQLYKNGILKKRVYDHIGLQRLLNEKLIGESIDPTILDILLKHKLISPQLTTADVLFMQAFGIFRDDIQFNNGLFQSESGEPIHADINNPASKQYMLDNCLGNHLKSGKLIHAGFFFGSVDFYTNLHFLPKDVLQSIAMSSIARTNTLSWSPHLLKLQRRHARFVNSSLMVTLLGSIVSDSLDNYAVLSGVGGQYDFISMANQLGGAHSIINCRSTRTIKNKVVSNIVWDFSNSTIPRYLRDFIVTEYGIADCRSKTDEEVIKSLLNITDSRFQAELMRVAKKSGKLSSDYQIPELFQNNYPHMVEDMMKKVQQQGYCQSYPFGSDLTVEEEKLAHVLLHLKTLSHLKLWLLVIVSFFCCKRNAEVTHYLTRMNLTSTNNIREYVYKKLVTYLLIKS